MIVGVMGTALISPLYPLYMQAWQLRTSDVSLIYVVYMLGALGGLLFFGRMPDRVGFRRVMHWSLALALLGTAISLCAWNLSSLIVGRFIVGISSTLMATSATAGFTALSPAGQLQRVAMLSGLLMAFGFGLGPLVGGMAGQWAPHPLRTTYLIPLLLGLLGWFALHNLTLPASALPRSTSALKWQDVMPKLSWPERASSGAFMLSSALPFLAFGVFGLYASMSPLFLDKLVPWHGPVVSGTAIALILFASALVQSMGWRLPTHWCGSLGLLSLALSNAFLLLNLLAGSSLLFVAGVAFTAIGHGMCSLAGLSMVNRLATPQRRSALLSTYLVIGYLGCVLPMMAIGWLADHWGMTLALEIFCCAIILGSGAVAVLFWRHPRMRPVRACAAAGPAASPAAAP